jgi:ABC-2 type transport system permease protein
MEPIHTTMPNPCHNNPDQYYRSVKPRKMKMTWHIARNELYNLFYSPIAWVMMILFLILASVDYVGQADYLLGAALRGGFESHVLEHLTYEFTVGKEGFLHGVLKNIFVYLPLLTMGLISREMSSGTIKLLHSSPVGIAQVVMGKYVAMLCFTFMLMLMLGIPLASMSISIINPDYALFLTSVLGIFIILSTYMAIGLFVSSLTSYQIIAAIITFVLFLALDEIGGWWQHIKLFSQISYYLDIHRKSSNLIKGLLNTRDLMYCVMISGSFLAFTIIRIKSRIQSQSRMRIAMRYCMVIGLAFIVGYITSRPALNIYFDATREKFHTITPPTQEMLSKLNDGELEVIAYANVLSNGYPALRPQEQNKILDRQWDKFLRFKPDIKFEYRYYYGLTPDSWTYATNVGKSLKEIAANQATSYRDDPDWFMPPEEVKKEVKELEAEEYRCFFVLKYKDRRTILRTFDDPAFFPHESEVAAAINRLVGTPPKLLWVTDEIERGPFSHSPRDYKKITTALGDRDALINKGYDFDSLSLKKVSSIPTDIAALVIVDPRRPFEPESIEKIKRYIDAGGNLYLTGEPDRREVTKPLFDMLGITARPGLLIHPDANFASNEVQAEITDIAKNLSPKFAHKIREAKKHYGDSIFPVYQPGASALEYTAKDGFVIEPLLVSSSAKSWNRLEPVNKDSLYMLTERLPSDERGSFATSLRMHRNIKGKEQRIIVNSDADFFVYPQRTRWNDKFSFWSFTWFGYGQFPSNTQYPEGIDNEFRLYTPATIPLLKIVMYWIIPAIIAIVGAVLLIRRKRK